MILAYLKCYELQLKLFKTRKIYFVGHPKMVLVSSYIILEPFHFRSPVKDPISENTNKETDTFLLFR